MIPGRRTSTARRRRCNSSRPSSAITPTCSPPPRGARAGSRRSPASATTTSSSRASSSRRAELVGEHASAARSQPYYLDVTNPLANKGAVVEHLCETLAITAEEVCTLGDMPNDVLMFARSGMSIAVGNADREVQRAARHVTRANDEDGFAYAIDRYVLRS